MTLHQPGQSRSAILPSIPIAHQNQRTCLFVEVVIPYHERDESQASDRQVAQSPRDGERNALRRRARTTEEEHRTRSFVRSFVPATVSSTTTDSTHLYRRAQTASGLDFVTGKNTSSSRPFHGTILTPGDDRENAEPTTEIVERGSTNQNKLRHLFHFAG